MNYIRLLNLYIAKMKKKLNRPWLYAEEEQEAAKKAKRLNVWQYHRKHGCY
jgi:hypothetical protein